MELIERERGTTVLGWPTFVQVIRAHPDYPKRDLSSAPILVEGPADVSMRGVPGQTPTHRGMSETAGSFFSTGIRIVDPTTGEPVPRGAEGELLVRGPGAMAGYYKKEAWEVFDDDGWFRTGDIVAQLPDDPRLFFGGRTTELIKSAGANVSPKEVEAVLDEFEEVQHSFVVGIEDEQRGEAVVAVVVPRDPAAFDPSAVEAKAREALSAYKVPRRYVVARQHDIPLLATGKPDRRRLAAMVRAGTLSPSTAEEV
jgi:acyl-CoA synthetase (AMP-forming)/AMP-acid ligase II